VRQCRSRGISLGSRFSFKYFRAVFGSMPALDAAISRFFSVFDNFLNLLTW